MSDDEVTSDDQMVDLGDEIDFEDDAVDFGDEDLLGNNLAIDLSSREIE